MSYISKNNKLTLNTDITGYIENKLKPLYTSLQNYQKEINKAQILEELQLDKDMVLQKVNNNINNELKSIEKVLYTVNQRANDVVQRDIHLAQELTSYYDELTS